MRNTILAAAAAIALATSPALAGGGIDGWDGAVGIDGASSSTTSTLAHSGAMGGVLNPTQHGAGFQLSGAGAVSKAGNVGHAQSGYFGAGYATDGFGQQAGVVWSKSGNLSATFGAAGGFTTGNGQGFGYGQTEEQATGHTTGWATINDQTSSD